MDLVARLKIYIDHLGLQISQFADIAKIPRPTLSQILTGRNKKISNELLVKLHNAFPRLNVSWLLFGDGEMEINGLPKIAAFANVPESSQKPENKQAAASQPNTKQPAQAPVQISAETIESTDELLQEPFVEPVGYKSPQPLAINPDTSKHIQSIMVFYSDNSFEIFKPSQR